MFFFSILFEYLYSAIATKNLYLYGDGRVLLDNFSHCISMISPFDGKLRRNIYDYTDKFTDQILYLAPEVIYQVCLNKIKIIKLVCLFFFFIFYRIKMDIILKVIYIV